MTAQSMTHCLIENDFRITEIQRILIFQQTGSGESKIEGIKRYGGEKILLEVVSIETPLPPVIDDAQEHLPKQINASLVLDFLKHPDLSYDLAGLCSKMKIPVVASGKKHKFQWAFTPPV